MHLKYKKVLYFNNINTKFAHLVDDQLRFYDLSPVIIEYDKNGNIYSLLIVDYRVNVAFNQFQDEQAPVRIVADIGIYSTKPAQGIRNYIRNYEFQNALIYTSKKSNIETSNPRVESNALSDSNNKNIKTFSKNEKEIEAKLDFLKKLHERGLINDKKYKESVNNIIKNYEK